MEPISKTIKRIQILAKMPMPQSSKSFDPTGTAAEPSRFAQQFGACGVHGAYPLNIMDEDGSERWFSGTCPACARQRRAEHLMRGARFTARHAGCTFDNYETTGQDGREHQGKTLALSLCREYAEQFPAHLADGRCLILLGSSGTGKNHLATAIARQVLLSGYSALKVKAADFLDEYWAKEFDERRTWMDRMAGIDLVFLDEVGRHSAGDPARNALFALVDARSEAMKPTVLMSNRSREEVETAVTPEGFDRLCERGGLLVRFNWESHRRGMRGITAV